MQKKARRSGIEFGINRGTADGDLAIISCNKRVAEISNNGVLFFRQEETPKLVWSVLMTILGAVVPAFMFLENTAAIRIVAVILFAAFQIGAVAIVNAGRPEVRVFDKTKGKYRIRRANHVLTRGFRKSWIDITELDRVSGVKLMAFKAKRWEMRWVGSGENKYRHQELRTFENYRLFLDTFGGEGIDIYDWYELDHAMETGEKIAGYLGVEFSFQ